MITNSKPELDTRWLRPDRKCPCGADRTGPSAEAHAAWCPEEITDPDKHKRVAERLLKVDLEYCGDTDAVAKYKEILEQEYPNE